MELIIQVCYVTWARIFVNLAQGVCMSLELEPFIPGRYLLQALASGFLREDSESRVNHFLESRGLTLQDLEESSSRFPVSWISQLVPKSSGVSPQILALRFGNMVRLTSQGDLSLVLMTSSSVRESLDAARYLRLHSNTLAIDFHEDHSAGVLQLDIDSGSTFTDEIILFYSFAAIRRLMSILTAQAPLCEVKLTCDEPTDFDRMELEDVGHWSFNQPMNCLEIERSFLDTPGIFGDPVEHALAVRACEKALAEDSHEHSLLAAIRNLMMNEGVWEQDIVAERLHQSKSTLKRRLSQRGLTFSDLQMSIRQKLAIQLLTTTDEPLQLIAERLGYSDQSNFSHAFKKWFNVSPREFKNSN